MQKIHYPISNKKLRGMTSITHENLGKVRGQISRFLKKPNKYLTHFTDVVGYEEVRTEFETFYKPIVDPAVSIPVYRPYINGKCGLHWLQTDPNYQASTSKPPMLAVTSPFMECCVPIHIGAKYKIFGNRLIIMDTPDSFFYKYPDKGRWVRYSEWVLVSEKELEEYNQQASQEKMKYLIYNIVLSSCDVAEWLWLPTCPCVIEDKLDYVNDKIEEDIRKDFAEGGVCRYYYKLNKIEFSLQIDFDKWKLDGDRNSFFFTMNGKKITLYEIIKATFQKEIDRARAEERRSDYF